MAYDFSVNQPLRVQTQHAGRERQPVLIIDDFLRDPESMVRYAAGAAQFKPSPLSYPGIVADAPKEYVDGLLAVLIPLIADTFGVKADTAFLNNSFFGIATFTAEQLHYGQRLPHVDAFHPGRIAILHYFCDPSQGGTALYRHRDTGYESLTKEQNYHMKKLIVQEVAANPVPAEYPNAKSRLFEQTAAFQAKFNRVLMYRGRILHSMMVDAHTRLHPDPRIGRLTINTFLEFELK
jgi:hypothetical protein